MLTNVHQTNSTFVINSVITLLEATNVLAIMDTDLFLVILHTAKILMSAKKTLVIATLMQAVRIQADHSHVLVAPNFLVMAHTVMT